MTGWILKLRQNRKHSGVSRLAFRLALLGALGLPVSTGVLWPAAVLAQEESPEAGQPQSSDSSASDSSASDSGDSDAGEGGEALPLAPDIKGERPRLNPTLVTPAATELQPGLQDLPAPDSLALPTRPEQVVIQELRPLSLVQVENLAEVNNPNLKAIASEVDQAQSALREQIALWYPSIDLNANALPSYSYSRQRNSLSNGTSETSSQDRWAAGLAITAQWALINPQRTPAIAAARDSFERAKYQYVIALRDLRLQAAQLYFTLQQRDDQVRIGQQSVRASLVSLRDSRARFQAGVATKLEVLEAETQLARDQQLLTTALAEQSISRRRLAALLDLPQNVTATAADPSRVLGVWQPSIQESIVAAYAFREELDQILLDISISNSNANAAQAASQPFLNIFAGFDTDFVNGDQGAGEISIDSTRSFDTRVGLNFSWSLFDGGASAAQARRSRQQAQQNRFLFADRRDSIREEVEESFYNLDKNNRNITTTAREVISARESLRLARLRFQAGVTTQREVVDTQRDLTQAEVRYAEAITEYNVNLAELRRRTGLDQITSCPARSLSPIKPEPAADIPVEPTPLLPACQAAVPGPA